MLGRNIRGRSYIVVARDSDEGLKAAELVANACRRGKASAVVWQLAGYGTEYPDLAAWCQKYRLDLLIAIEQPWKPRATETKRESHSDVLLRLAQSIELFRTPDGDAYATITVKGLREHHTVTSETLASWLLHAYYQETSGVPTAEAMQNAIKVLVARAVYEEGTKDTRSTSAWPRTRPPTGTRFTMLTSATRPERGRITAAGGGRDRAAGAVPPASGPRRLADTGTRRDPRPPLGVFERRQRGRSVARCGFSDLRVAAQGPFPSQSSRVSRKGQKHDHQVVQEADRPAVTNAGHASQGSARPDGDREIDWAVSFDNLWATPVRLSDALSRLSTGGGFSTRKLHSDDEEMFFEATRPIVLNSIEEIASRADLLDRSVVITCPSFPDLARGQEKEFWGSFRQSLPAVTGGPAGCRCGRHADAPAGESRPVAALMADFARWGEAVCRSLGHPEGTFLKAYAGNRDASAAAILEDSAIAACLIDFRQPGQTWSGTNQQLLDALHDHARCRSGIHHAGPSRPRLSPLTFAGSPPREEDGSRRLLPDEPEQAPNLCRDLDECSYHGGTPRRGPRPPRPETNVTNRHHRHQARF